MPYYKVKPKVVEGNVDGASGNASTKDQVWEVVYVASIGNKVLRTFIESLSAARILLRVGVDCLNNVPDSLPASVKDQFIESLHATSQRELDWVEHADGSTIAVVDLVELEEHGISNDIAIVANIFGARDKREPLHLESVATSQFVVIAFALFDAFVSDILRVVSLRESRTLKVKKSLTWEEIISAGSYEKVIETIIDTYLFEVGKMRFKDKIEHIEGRYGVEIPIDTVTMSNLVIAEQARHLFTHTGGIVSSKFLEVVKDSKFSLGDKVNIDYKYCMHLSNSIRAVAQEISVRLSEKYLSNNEESMDAVE